MPTGYEGEIKAADGLAIKVNGGTGDLRNYLKAAYFQIRTVARCSRRLPFTTATAALLVLPALLQRAPGRAMSRPL